MIDFLLDILGISTASLSRSLFAHKGHRDASFSGVLSIMLIRIVVGLVMMSVVFLTIGYFGNYEDPESKGWMYVFGMLCLTLVFFLTLLVLLVKASKNTPTQSFDKGTYQASAKSTSFKSRFWIVIVILSLLLPYIFPCIYILLHTVWGYVLISIIILGSVFIKVFSQKATQKKQKIYSSADILNGKYPKIKHPTK